MQTKETNKKKKKKKSTKNKPSIENSQKREKEETNCTLAGAPRIKNDKEIKLKCTKQG
jgi:hypothetical protein